MRHSDAAIDERRLCACLSAFDEVRALEMNELWAAPSALAAVLMRACLSAGDRAVSAERERIAAAQWAEAGGDLNTPGGDNSQFFSPTTGFPSIQVPMGYTRGVLPAGITLR